MAVGGFCPEFVTGPDFVVYRIEPIVPLDGGSGSIGIYVGDNPESPPGAWAGTVEAPDTVGAIALLEDWIEGAKP